MSEDTTIIPEEEHDPFSNDNAPGLALIVQMRIYDVLCAIYREMNPEMATALMDVHAKGKILASLPSFDPGTEEN